MKAVEQSSARSRSTMFSCISDLLMLIDSAKRRGVVAAARTPSIKYRMPYHKSKRRTVDFDARRGAKVVQAVRALAARQVDDEGARLLAHRAFRAARLFQLDGVPLLHLQQVQVFAPTYLHLSK